MNKPKHEIGPKERAVRTAIQVVVALVAAIPTAAAAFSAVGVELAAGPLAIAMGIGGAFVVFASAAQNAWDSRPPK